MVFEKDVFENKSELIFLEKAHEKSMEKIEEEALRNKNKYLESMKKKGELDSKRLISKSETLVQKELLIKKLKILDEFNLFINKEIKTFISSKEYEAYFKTRYNEALVKFADDKDIKIFLREEDVKFTDNKNYVVETTKDIIGGFYLVKENKIKFDFTIDGELAEISSFIGCLIQNLVGTKVGDSNECK